MNKPRATMALLDGREKPLVGWREWAGFPDFGVANIKAKIDTGAKTSAVHAFDILYDRDNQGELVSFMLHPVQRRRKPEIACEARLRDFRLIRSSNGQVEERPVVRTRLALAGKIFTIDLTLTNRDAMGFRLLIGRDALRRRFLIDPGASYIGGKRKTRS